MKKNRILSALLCLSLAAGLVIPGLPAYAEGEGESGSNSGMKLNKTAVANGDGTYTITLEAYATGQKVISQVNKDVPTDIVLVLDQSGSMTNDMNTYDFREYTGKRNRDYYSLRHNNNDDKGNLYYKLEDGSYATVSVTRTQGESTNNYTQCPSDWKNYTYYDGDDDYWKYSNNLYVMNEAGEYQKVTVTYKEAGGIIFKDYNYFYAFPNGKTVTSQGNDGKPGKNNFDGYGPVYYLSGTTAGEYTYTYTCTDAEGNTIDIGTSTGANTVPTEFTLYERYQTGTTTRLAALKSAVTTFTNSVAEKAKGEDGQLGTPDDIDHRIAVVGFAARKDTNPGDYVNTELFIGATQYKYGTAAQGQYGNAFQNMKTSQGQGNVAASIGALDAYGGTHIDLGMEMAKGILDNSPVPSGEKRNRVVIVFTDGSPGSGDWSSNDMTYAQNAIAYANTLRGDSVNVYAVGIFSGADASSAGKSDGNNTEKANWFMQNLSDNKGTPQTPGFYLSAADSATLTSIFKQIADNIESGGTTTTLGESAVIKDIISPQFTLPAGTTPSNITLETYSYTGENQWTKNPDAMGATPAVNGDQVSVTGFDFAKNWCGTEKNNGTTTYRGNKLVISFTVSPKAGFLGGNNVFTNTSAGVYKNAEATTPVLEFNRPQVNVPIKDVIVTPEGKNVYLLNGVTLDELKTGATVTVGKVPLDLSKENYGLEAWQNQYVDITVAITDKNGNPVPAELADLTDDTTYTVTVTVTPKPADANSDGEPATEQKGSGTAKINVYKPELTYKDSEVFYGDNLPTNFDTYNRTATKWKHGETEANDSKMGDAPALTITYTPDANKIDENNKIASTEDIQVKATVKIGSEDVTTYTIFAHTACAEGVTCGWNETTLDGDPAFLLHVKTATLKITKEGADGNKNEGFIFNVTGPNNLTFRVSVKDNGTVKITGLPLGEYTVTEDEGWSWRYKAENSGKVELTETAYEGSVTIKNAKDNPYLLDGSAYAQNNSKSSAAGN